MEYCIAGIGLEVDSAYSLESSWQAFEAWDHTEESNIVCSRLSFLTVNKELSFAECGDTCKIFMSENSFMMVDRSFRHAYVSTTEQMRLSIFLAYLFYTHAIERHMLKVHCSVIEDQGRGILFLGPSGIGKTTQAERWAEYRGSSIINGDVGFVQRTVQGYTAWGTPWHGSSPYCLNTSVPVKALVVLKQAPQNSLRELTGLEKVKEVGDSILYPTWLEDGIERCVDILNSLLIDLPVYRLDNRADREAVDLLAEELEHLK